ncbi:MAG: MFS transporter [Ignavibacteriaceae bacterium]|nr:MFS transporter [Ignavibacteriaceae bacterium]
MKDKGRVFVWTLFDFANTSFSIIVVTFLYAVYFKKTVAGNEAIGDLYWSISTSIAMIITAIISPVLGAIADFSAGKKRFLLFFTSLCVIGTASLYFIGPGQIFWGLSFSLLQMLVLKQVLFFTMLSFRKLQLQKIMAELAVMVLVWDISVH